MNPRSPAADPISYATVMDVARRAGVSHSTAARVLTGSGAGVIRVSSETSERIQRIAKSMNFRASRGARLLRAKKADILGVMIDPQPSLLSSVRVAAMESVARAAGFQLMVVHDILDRKVLEKTSADLKAWGVQGLVCIHHYFPADKMLVPSVLKQFFDHLVFINKPGMAGLWSVGCDMTEISRSLVLTLAEKGKREPVLLIGDDTWFAGKRFIEGFKSAVDELGLKHGKRRILITTDIGLAADTPYVPVQELSRLVDRILRLGANCILAGQAGWAVQIIQELQRRKVRVPEDIAIAALGDIDVCSYFSPSITAGDSRSVEVSVQAIRLLIDMHAGKTAEAPCALLIPPLIHWRQSA